MAATRTLLFTLLILVLIETAALAETSVEFLVNFLQQNGQGGKQVIDGSGNQELKLYEPIIFVDTQLTETTNFHIEGVYDSFSSASARAFDLATGASAKNADATTGASLLSTQAEEEDGQEAREHGLEDDGEDGGETSTSSQNVWESRRAIDLSIAQKLGTWVFVPSFGTSAEYDYISRHGGLALQKSFAEDNFIVSLGAFYYQDSVYAFDMATGLFTRWTPKLTRSYNLSLSQLLGPMDVILLGGSYTLQTGLLSSISNTVVVPQGRVQEVLPNSRDKWTGTVRYIHGFSPILAAHVDYRYYTDNWGIVANTVEPSLVFGTEEETDLLQIAYRHHFQQGTRYYGDSFPAATGFMTSDSDLQTFTAREVRLHYEHHWDLPDWLKSIAGSATVAYYVRDNDLQAWLFQLGLSGVF